LRPPAGPAHGMRLRAGMNARASLESAIVPCRRILLFLAVLIWPMTGCGNQTSSASSASDAATTAGPAGALQAFIDRAEPGYRWKVLREGTVAGTEYTELVLVSQEWRGVEWRHQLFVFWPTAQSPDSRHALFMIDGGQWRPGFDDPERAPPPPRDAEHVAEVAESLGTPVAVLRQVPFQPMFGGLTEDDLIAYTFERFLETGEPDWPLLFPMVNAAVRGMDAVQQVGRLHRGVAIDDFIVFGASKRGWTTWLVGAVDPRVAAIAPVSIDMLNLERHLALQRETWGRYSEQIQPYVALGLPDRLDGLTGRALLDMVDPFRYRSRLLVPKLIVLGTNDRYWPLDALGLYWDSLPDPKRVLYLPNTGHRPNDYARLKGALGALHDHVVHGAPLPRPVWRFDETPDAVRLHVESDAEPRAVTAWRATAPTRDFREASWEPAPCRPAGAGFLCEAERAADGYTALFAELEYATARGPTLYLSTRIRVAGPPEPGLAQ